MSVPLQLQGSRSAMADGFLIAPMCDAVCDRDVESLQLPKDWATSVRNAVLNVVGIVRMAVLPAKTFWSFSREFSSLRPVKQFAGL